MKRILALLGFLLIPAAVLAAPPVAEAPIKDIGIPVTVSISTSVLTMVPTSQTVGRMGIFIDAPSSNSARVVGFLDHCTATTNASTIRPIEIAPGTNSSYFGIREDVCLWLISLNTSAENIHYQEVLQ